MTEGNLTRRILREHGSRPDLRLFRQNVGVAWAGDVVSRNHNTITLARYRPLHAGLCPGSSDIIGLRSIRMTEDMVGQRLAMFAAIEVKTGRQKPTKEQRAFLEMVGEKGGLALVARSVDDVERSLSWWP